MRHYKRKVTKNVMKKVTINPGICNLITSVIATSEDQMEVTLNVTSGCEAVKKMMLELGDTFDAYEICLTRPGHGPFYEYAAANFPGHASCPAIAGILNAPKWNVGLLSSRMLLYILKNKAFQLILVLLFYIRYLKTFIEHGNSR